MNMDLDITRDSRIVLRDVKFTSAADLLRQPAPTQWLVRDILAAGSLVTLIGAPGCYKSAVALDISASIATGIPWRDKPTKRGAVFFIAGEGRSGINRRLKAWSIVRSSDLAGAPLFISSGVVALVDPLDAAAVASEVRRVAAANRCDPVLVVIDTLARNFGPGDENSASDMGRFIANLDRHVREPFGCCVLIVHHTGVGDSGRARGSSALRAAVDTEIVVERTDRTAIVRCSKSKDSPEFEPLAFESRIVELPWKSEDGASELSFIMEQASSDASSDAFVRTSNTSKFGRNERKAFYELGAMYAEYRLRLEQAGQDPNDALVPISEWRQRCGLDRKRWSETQFGLEERRLIRLEHPHVILL